MANAADAGCIMAQTAADFYRRGSTEAKAGNIAGAIADYDKAFALNPNDAIAYVSRGIAS